MICEIYHICQGEVGTPTGGVYLILKTANLILKKKTPTGGVNKETDKCNCKLLGQYSEVWNFVQLFVHILE
jgi:hypothetical protein